ncbi:50S ribosomal protein L4 [archaeon]|nr:50S ribosomal protein L4 [archaeon]|tara:strand:- start:300 stop:1100 length:801 start_codon:yes stop_codon:yes gene_type:complete
MKANILNLKGEKIKTIDLPIQFEEPFHPNIIKRAVQVILTNLRQKYGAKPEAGKRASAELSRRRRKYRGSYGFGISRVPRKILWRRGRRFGWAAAFAPGTVSGRRAHPPKASKEWNKKINTKERRKAIRSALSATNNKELVTKRGHVVNIELPIIFESKLETISKTKEIQSILSKLLNEELKRSSIKKIRAGKGTRRGRKYKKKKGPLIVVSKNCPLVNSAKNIPGIDVCTINLLNANLLAPGTEPGRLTIFTEDSIEKLRGGLFL